MPTSPDRMRAIFRCFDLLTATNLVYAPQGSSSVIAVVLAAHFQELTVANIDTVRHDVAVVGPDVTPGGAGAYQTNADMCTIQMATGVGGSGPFPITIAAPKASIFLADTETLNLLNADVMSFVAFLIANCTDNAGTPFVGVIKGWRWRLDV